MPKIERPAVNTWAADEFIVRPVRGSDAQILHEIRLLNAEFQGPGRSLDDTRAMYVEMERREPGAEPGWHQYVIQHRSNEIVGDIGVNFDGPGPRQVELGYSLHPNWWGRGAASSGLTQILNHLFQQRNLHRAIAVTALDNERSRKLLERLGFRHEGSTLESWQDTEDCWSDEVIYAILGREWRLR